MIWNDNRFLQLLDSRPWLLADGATGTNLFHMGLQTGDAPELWNQDHPERIRALHQGFVDAGADIFLTNSFGGTRYRLKLHQAQDRVHELNVLAAGLGREIADAAGRPVAVAGSMGPTGEIIEPLGPLSEADATEAFTEQALALAEGGVDVLWIETMSSPQELQAALRGAAATDLPVVCTCSFDTNGCTMMGLTPAGLVDICREAHPGPTAFGSNCGVGAAELVASLVNMRGREKLPAVLVSKANCGIPEWLDGEIRYTGTPEVMADYACLARDAGARIIGGCCGTTPEHLRAMHQALNSRPPGETPDIGTIEARLGPVSTGGTALASGETGEYKRPVRGTRRGRRARSQDGDRATGLPAASRRS